MTRALCLALLVATAVAGGAQAQTLTVAIDHSTRLNVAGSAASVVVGNPSVADVIVVDSHTVFVSGRGYGETDLIVLDGGGRTLYSGEVLVGSPSAGRVSVYRGGDRTDMACAPGCEVSFRSPAKVGAGSGSQGGASAAPANSAPSLGSMLSGAVGGGAQAVSSGMRAPQ